MARIPSIKALIDQNLWKHAEWGPYARGERPLPTDRPHSAHWVAVFFFYLGDVEKAQEVSLLYHKFEREQASQSVDRFNALFHLFRAALFADLSGKYSLAEEYWRRLVHETSQLSEDEIVKADHAHLWIYQAYGYAKLGRFQLVSEPAMLGRTWIEKGKSVFDAPHRNSLEYELGPLLTKLAKFKLGAGTVTAEDMQEALRLYKRENFQYGRKGYPVIFDLQFSYPEVFDPVLPGEDPEKD